MKILLIGLGAIGRRHLKILLGLGFVKVGALRTAKGALKEEVSGIEELFTLEDALAFQPDGVIISNPTALHAASALPFLQQDIPVLIEKPIAHTLKEAQKLAKYEKLIRIAYCLRFLPIYNMLQSILKKEIPFKLGFKRSYFLPKWHPYTDYTREYVAKKELGGGVLRTLSHEIDLAVSWFGKPDSTIGLTDKVSFLDIDTDDYAYFTLKYQNGLRVNYELDLFSPVNINEGEAYTNNGKYTWNMEYLQFQQYNAEQPTYLYQANKNDLDLMYLRQIEDFIDFIKEGKSINTTFNEAISTLEIIESIEK